MKQNISLKMKDPNIAHLMETQSVKFKMKLGVDRTDAFDNTTDGVKRNDIL